MDTLITAIGEQADEEVLHKLGVPLDDAGYPQVNTATGETTRPNVFLIGDVQRGPSSIVAAIGSARNAAETVLARENVKTHHADKYWSNVDPAEIYRRKGTISVAMVDKTEREAFVAQEAQRCLECNYVCSNASTFARTAPTCRLPYRASRIVSRPCTWTPTATNAVTAPSSAHGRVSHTKTR